MGLYFVVNVALFLIGLVVLIRLRKKYRGINNRDFLLVVVLYALLVFLFTDGIVEIIKNFIEESVL